MLTADKYDEAFYAETQRQYPEIDLYELGTAHIIGRRRLEDAARVLACPVKENPPCWQHGRVIYSTYRRRLEELNEPVTMLDIGTAKGFSALVALWSLLEARSPGHVISVDVIDPAARVSRNTVAEVNGLRTLSEILEPWPESKDITFLQSSGVQWLGSRKDRVHFAFVDGKHTFDTVAMEAAMLSRVQRPGDIAVFDDVHIHGVMRAVRKFDSFYEFVILRALENRAYAVGTRL